MATLKLKTESGYQTLSSTPPFQIPVNVGAEWGEITGTLSDQTDLQTALNGKQNAVVNKSTMDAIATANTQYFLGTQTTVSVTLPNTATIGDRIHIVFYSGSTATTLSISGSTIGTIPVPATNQRVEMSLLYDGTYWGVLSNTIAVGV